MAGLAAMTGGAPLPFVDTAGAERFLAALGNQPGPQLPIAAAALALAALQRPGAELDRYHHHLGVLSDDVAAAAADCETAEDRGMALAAVLGEKHGYRGDTETYDDLQNANLIRVIDRRRGLPVSLGILYIHAARAQGWDMVGLAFPGHFLIRLEHEGERVILDPFNGGRRCAPAELRQLLKAMGAGTELTPEHYAAVADRDVLIRLQNNIKLRRMQAQDAGRALEAVRAMLLFAPTDAGLWRECGVLNGRLGNLKSAIAALETCLTHATDAQTRHNAAALLQQLRRDLN